jgi:NAD(P)-dependent dehydrogenase (short-subunit alcohol dehydrogenase family)
MRGLAGRVLISGGSSGIGLATAERFLAEKSRVFIAGLDAAEVDDAVARLRRHGEIAGVAGDVSDDRYARRSVLSRSEERVDRVDHPVLLVHHRDDPPLVEGGARMRDAQADEVARGER